MKIVELFIKFLNAIGIYTRSQMNELTDSRNTLAGSLDEHKVTVSSLASQLEEKTTEVENLRHQLNEMTERASNHETTITTLRTKLDEVTAEVDSSREAAMENLDLIKELQKQVGDLFHDHPVFGFPTGIPIPGSTCVTTSDYTKEDGTNVAVLRGRSILTDDMTDKIDSTPGIVERTKLITSYMETYGLFAKIGKDLMNRGGIKLTLAYNRNCTAYEVYYETVVDHASGDAIVFVDKSKPEEVTEE